MSGSQNSYVQAAVDAANNAGIDPQAFLDRITAESNWNPNAINSTTGAQGLGQVLPSTAANPGYGVSPLTNPLDPVSNLNFSANLLAAYQQATGSLSGALAKYTGQPQSNFTQYDSTSSSLTGSATQSGVISTPSSNQTNKSFWTDPSGFIGNLFVESVVVVLGLIFVAVGLVMLSSGKSAVQVVGGTVKKAGEAAALA